MVRDGVLEQLSVSQAEQYQRCPRSWWFERVHSLTPDQSEARRAGESGHELLAMHLMGQTLPTRASMLTAVKGAILKGELPTPGTDLLVEIRGSGQEKFHPTEKDEEGNPKWVPLDRAKALWLGGLPWDTFIDLAHRREPAPVVMDHKFSSDPRTYAKKSDALINTIQMPVYVLDLARRWPDATEWTIAHHNVAKTGVDSFIRKATVHIDNVRRRGEEIATLVGEMKQVAAMTNQGDVPHRRGPQCEKFGGCPHQSVCNAFKRKEVAMTAEEEDLFAQFDKTLDETPKKKKLKIKDVEEPPEPGSDFNADKETPDPAPTAPPPAEVKDIVSAPAVADPVVPPSLIAPVQTVSGPAFVLSQTEQPKRGRKPSMSEPGELKVTLSFDPETLSVLKALFGK